jgi:hypothetical protein
MCEQNQPGNYDVNIIKYKQDKQKAWSNQQNSMKYHKQINYSLIEKYKSIKHMTCIKTSKIQER